MSSTNPQGRVLDTPFEGFATSSASHEYKLPKALLCKQSPYFAAKFEGNFREGEEQSTTLQEMDGVVSTRSFQMLAQWVCLGRVVFGESPPKEDITATIEFVRFTDMCGVTGMESLMAEHIKAIIIANPAPKRSIMEGRDPNTNTYSLTSQHITSAASLPSGHPVRRVLATATVEGYLRHDNYKFLKESQEVPNFSVDLLTAVKATLKTISMVGYRIQFEDPIGGETLPLEE